MKIAWVEGMNWELRSRSGLEASRWTVKEVHSEGCTCDVQLAGRYFGETLGSETLDDLEDFRLEIRGLRLQRTDLLRLTEFLRGWLELPMMEIRNKRLELSVGMGCLHDQHLILTLGQRADTLSEGRPVATLAYTIGRMRGEFVYPVDLRGLRTFVDGIEAVIGGEREHN